MSKKKRARTRSLERAAFIPDAAAAHQSTARRWPAILPWVEPLSIGVLYIYLLAKTWLRWMDPLIDFPRDLYFAWRMAEGDLLYRQLTNWYGPLPQLVQGAASRIFGVGIDTIVWTNIGLTAAVLILVRDIFRTLGDRWSGWLATMVFLGVFAFGHYSSAGNYNFIAPYVASSTYCFAGLLLVLCGLVHHLKSERPTWLSVAGLGLAVTYLDKPEGLLAALGSLGVYFMVRFIQAARIQPAATDWRGAGRWARSATIWLAGGFLALTLPVFLYFLVRGGLRYAILAANFVPYSVLNNQFRHTLMTAHSQLGFFGFDQPWNNFVRQLEAGALLVLVCGVIVLAAKLWTRASKFSTRWWASLGMAGGAAILGEWLAESLAKHWLEIGSAFVFPVIIAAAITLGWSLWAAWTGRSDWPQTLGLAVVGVAAALMLARMVLNGRIYHFGFFMMPLAALWVVHLMVVESARPAPGSLRANRLLPVVFSALVLVGVMVLGQTSLHNYALKNYKIGEGRDQFYTFGPEVFHNGQIVQALTELFKERTPTARTLVVFPEGIAINYHLRIPTTLTEMDFQPVALAYAGPAHVLAELEAHPPDCIFLFDRDYSEFNVPYFGADEASGLDLVLWINDHYWEAGIAGQTEKTASRHEVDILKLRTPGSSGVELLHDARTPPPQAPASP